MSQPSTLKLVSFKICPFVQRATIVLNEKQVPYEISYLQPGAEQPDWFKAISPMGKVPVLVVDETPVFESAVILEYLEEVYAPKLHPEDSLVKARHRAWMEFASELFAKQFKMVSSKDHERFSNAATDLQNKLQTLEKALAPAEDYFSGATFALVDAVYAPLFMRLQLLKQLIGFEITLSARLQRWSDVLLARPAVQTSVVPEFEQVFMQFLQAQQGAILQQKPAESS